MELCLGAVLAIAVEVYSEHSSMLAIEVVVAVKLEQLVVVV